VVAAEHFGGDHLLAAVRSEHRAFYIRSFGSQILCDARPYPLLLKPISLTTVYFPTQGAELYRRYPFYHSTQLERRKLFERPQIKPAAANVVEPADVPLAPQTRGPIRPFVESRLMSAAG
jgi:hypothetical protein